MLPLVKTISVGLQPVGEKDSSLHEDFSPDLTSRLPSGKTTTMLGSPESGDQLGIIPTAISWLYRGIGEHKQKSGARFSVRVSAVQIAGAAENLRDLLKDHAKGENGEGTGT